MIVYNIVHYKRLYELPKWLNRTSFIPATLRFTLRIKHNVYVTDEKSLVVSGAGGEGEGDETEEKSSHKCIAGRLIPLNIITGRETAGRLKILSSTRVLYKYYPLRRSYFTAIFTI